MKVDVIDKDGKKIGTKNLDVSAIEQEQDSGLLHEFNRFVNNRFREGKASTKTRSEVNISKAKAYKQKGTGNARRGANSTPLRRGGGVTFGPKPRFYNFKLNKKSISLAISQMLIQLTEKRCQVLSDKVELTKTAEAKKLKSSLNANKLLILVTEYDLEVIKPFRNLKNVFINYVNTVDPDFLLTMDAVLFTEKALVTLEDKVK